MDFCSLTEVILFFNQLQMKNNSYNFLEVKNLELLHFNDTTQIIIAQFIHYISSFYTRRKIFNSTTTN